MSEITDVNEFGAPVVGKACKGREARMGICPAGDEHGREWQTISRRRSKGSDKPVSIRTIDIRRGDKKGAADLVEPVGRCLARPPRDSEAAETMSDQQDGMRPTCDGAIETSDPEFGRRRVPRSQFDLERLWALTEPMVLPMLWAAVEKTGYDQFVEPYRHASFLPAVPGCISYSESPTMNTKLYYGAVN